MKKVVSKADTPRSHKGLLMSDKRESEAQTKIRPSWGGNCGKRSDPPPTPRKKNSKTFHAVAPTKESVISEGGSSPKKNPAPLPAPDPGDLSRTSEFFPPTGVISRLEEELRASKRDAERLRMTLSRLSDLLNSFDSTT